MFLIRIASGDSNENIQYTSFNIKRKFIRNYPKSAGMGFFQGTQERVRNSRGKRAISVRAIEVLLYNKNTSLDKSCPCSFAAFHRQLMLLQISGCVVVLLE